MKNVEAIFLFGIGAIIFLCWGFGELHFESASLLSIKGPANTVSSAESPDAFYYAVYGKVAIGLLFSLFTSVLIFKK